MWNFALDSFLESFATTEAARRRPTWFPIATPAIATFVWMTSVVVGWSQVPPSLFEGAARPAAAQPLATPPAAAQPLATQPPAASPTSLAPGALGAAPIVGAATPGVPAAAVPAAAAPAAEPERPPTRVTKGSGVLPNDHGQVWREYDIQPYTSQVTSTQRPEQAIIDWILRETGTEVWFSEPLGILNADKNTLRVYHTPDMQKVVAAVVDRFVGVRPDSQMLSLRLATVNSPTWRSRAYTMLRPVTVQSPGIEAWLVSRENAAFLVAELSRRADYREHNSPNLVIHNGQAHTVSRLRPKTYARSVRPRDTVLPGFDTETGSIEEGYSLQVSPLFSLDRRTVDAVIKCHIDQVERLVPVPLELPSLGGQPQRAQVQVPQLVSWRLHERFRWPVDQVLLLSCGVVAAPAAESRPASALVSALSSSPSRADALLFIECHNNLGGNLGTPAPSGALPTAGRPSSYRGRY